LTGRVTLTVTADDTALAFGSGDVPVLATPRIVALVEQATVAAISATLEPGSTTVGTRVELDHLGATGVGATVAAEAELTDVDGRALRFTVTVNHGGRTIAEGMVNRVVVDRERFLHGIPA
jgi:predicted thioesterase